MNKKTRNIRIWIALALALLFVTSGMLTVATAMNLGLGRGTLRAIALAGAAGALVCALAARSLPGVIAAAVLIAVGVGAWLPANRAGLQAVGEFAARLRGGEADPALSALGGGSALTCAAALIGALFFVMLYRRELNALAVTLLTVMLVASHAVSETASLATCVPGLIGIAAAIALMAGVQRDASAARVLIPAALAVAAALLLIPAGRVTWQPLEDAAEKVRSAFEQYFNFTYERIAFSLNEEGYNHGAEVDGQAVAMLGGPAQPDQGPVMRVRADVPVLLRGTIRAAYTGWSWVDTQLKNRYLYYDLTHRSVRERVFDMDLYHPVNAFQEASAEVEFLDSGTSTLFAPSRLSKFNMDLSTAVYYNSSGEMFLAREVKPGDRYSLTASLPVYGEALRRAVVRGESANDDRYSEIMATHTALPAGVEDRLYALTIALTRNAENAYDRAAAIEDYLRGNMRYRLDVDYPPANRDFVSWFVLDSKEGYCSYFASAMAVMGRIAGLPTRYVEGYYARPGEDGSAVLSGQDAHAWAEVYFRGVGWVPFDATNGGPGDREPGEGGDVDRDDQGDNQDSSQPDVSPSPSPSPSPEPSLAPQGGQDDSGNGNSGENEQDDQTPPGQEPEQEPPEQEPPEQKPDRQDEPDDESRHSRRVLIAILLMLLILLLIALWVRMRLRRADPVRLCGRVKSAQQAGMIAYRANLTLLQCMGLVPGSAETPEAFARRVASQQQSPDFAAFGEAVARSRYARAPLKKEDIQSGLRAYLGFKKGMRLSEKLRFTIVRVFHGLGDFESIP